MQCLYGFEIVGNLPAGAEEAAEKIAPLEENAMGPITVDLSEPEDRQFVDQIIALAPEHIADVDRIIKNNATNWPIDRISKVDLAILRLSILEMEYLKTPEKIAINEAVNLAKKYSGDKAYKFVNGVLAGYVKNRQTSK